MQVGCYFLNILAQIVHAYSGQEFSEKTKTFVKYKIIFVGHIENRMQT